MKSSPFFGQAEGVAIAVRVLAAEGIKIRPAEPEDKPAVGLVGGYPLRIVADAWRNQKMVAWLQPVQRTAQTVIGLPLQKKIKFIMVMGMGFHMG